MEIIFKIRKVLFVFATLTGLLLFGCENDSDADYGFALIYMPQAAITGIDNSYPIPRGPIDQHSTYSCYYDNGKLNIALGVIRSGKIANAKGFSVNIGVSQEETEAAVIRLNNSGTDAIALPNVYTLPGSISVEAGTNFGSVYLSIDMNALAKINEIAGNDEWKRLVLAVKVSNPSEYELSGTNTSVVIIIDLNSAFWKWGTPPNLVYTK
jgi:hypothetical protein